MCGHRAPSVLPPLDSVCPAFRFCLVFCCVRLCVSVPWSFFTFLTPHPNPTHHTQQPTTGLVYIK